MKRNNLTTAVLAGLAGAVGIAGSAQAVNLNPDGLGQVLIYPYYTTRGGNDTLLSVVNTTDEAKAVKVRFLESQNTREVLDFNLYMSAFDVWVAAITDDAGIPTLIVNDNSCTVPYIFGDLGGSQEFLNFAYSGNRNDGGSELIDRASEGHFEIIEMGVLTDVDQGSASAATHSGAIGSSAPADCGQLVDAWTDELPFGPGQAGDGYWIDDNALDITAPSGGLFGGAAVINPTAGAMYSYDAAAMNGFWQAGAPESVRHTNPGSELPSLGSAFADTSAFIFLDDGSLVTATYVYGVEAVSAVFMHDQVMNEYNIQDSINAKSEWVVTFPTKRFYVDPDFDFDGAPTPNAPFTQALDVFGDACENFELQFWGREEETPTPETIQEGPIVSPPPPVDDPPVILFELCNETNVIRFGDDNAGAPSEILGSVDAVTFDLPDGWNNGWARLNMKDYFSTVDGADLGDRTDSFGLVGLPVAGFWVEQFTNGTLQGGTVLANYGGIFGHKGTRQIAVIQ